MSNLPARPATVAIVGGGFSGTAVALHLLRGAADATTIVLVEPRADLGRGLAYSTPSDSHCLNVPAGRLGIDPAREAGFADWLHAQGHVQRAHDFVPRHWFGRHLASELSDAADSTRATFVSVHARVESIARSANGATAYELRLSTGELLRADQVVLATGHLPTQPPPFAGSATWTSDNMVADPWRDNGLAILPASRDVLLIGSGLTAIDVVSQLREQGHRGRIHLLSRRGLLPQAHRANEARPPVGPSPVDHLPAAPTLRGLAAATRAWIRDHEAAGGDWRDVMAGLRPWTPPLWQRLGPRDRRQFLRHLQPFWDTHRHRLAPAIHARLQAEIARGDVQVHAGRLARVDTRGDGQFDVRWHARGVGVESTLVVGRVVNCTGPTANLGRHAPPPLASLRDAGLLRVDDLGLGVVVDEHLRLVDATDAPVPGLRHVGPLLKARFWEAVAVPELRVHARDVAQAILAELRRSQEPGSGISSCAARGNA